MDKNLIATFIILITLAGLIYFTSDSPTSSIPVRAHTKILPVTTISGAQTAPIISQPTRQDNKTFTSALTPEFLDPSTFYDPMYWYGGWFSQQPNNYYHWYDDSRFRPGHKVVPPHQIVDGNGSHYLATGKLAPGMAGMSAYMGSR